MTITASLVEAEYQVGTPCAVEIRVISDGPLQPGDTVELQLPNSWIVKDGPSFTRELQSEHSEAPHHITIECPGENIEFKVEIRRRHLCYFEGVVRHGRHIVGTLVNGELPAGKPVIFKYSNTYAPLVAETDSVWIKVNGDTDETQVRLRVEPSEEDSLRVIVPSAARPGVDFDVLIISLDRYLNRSSRAFKNAVLTLNGGTVIAEGLNFTGGCRVSSRLLEEGIFRFRFNDSVSNAIRIAADIQGPYWGDLHIHSKLSHDGYGTDPYNYAHEVSGLDFAGLSDHWESLGPPGYNQVIRWAEEYNRPGIFVTLPGDERNPRQFTGHHNIFFRDIKGLKAATAVQDNATFSNPHQPDHLQQSLDPATAMLIPHHTGIAWRHIGEDSLQATVDMEACDDAGLRTVMEIYSHHGQSELWNPQHALSYELNRLRRPERRSNASIAGPFYAQDFWRGGHRLGVIGSSDEHSGQAGRPHGGLAAVFAREHSREAIFDALRERSCYATTGERILLDFSVAGLPMGAEGTLAPGARITIELKVWGTDTLLRVEVLRYRFGQDDRFTTIYSDYPQPESTDVAVSLSEVLESDTMYYARITQGPVEWPDMAWSSPVWIDVR